MRIIEAISRFRAGGYDERLGFTVYDTLRYKQALEPLVAEEVEVLTRAPRRRHGRRRGVELIEAGAAAAQRPDRRACTPKLLVAELERHRASSRAETIARRADLGEIEMRS